jgi:hypothetical protein
MYLTMIIPMNRLTIADALWEDIQYLLDQVRDAQAASGTTS